MANNNNIDGVITTTNTQIIGNGYTLPSDFNNSRQPGELAKLFNANSNVIYNKFSAKTGQVGLLRFGPKQPFISFNPNTGTKGINALKGAVPSIGAPLQDVERITKWQLTGTGVIFIAKQFLLQGQNAFNETKIYNPAMPILSVASRASFGLIPTPTRHLDLSGGFASILGFGSSPRPISTTVAASNGNALSNQSKLAPNAYKGMLRGVTATSGFTSLSQKWAEGSNNAGGGFLKAVGGYLKSAFNIIKGTFIPVGQPGSFQYRADEQTYGRMLGNQINFYNFKSDGTIPIGVYQRFWSGKEITNKKTPLSYVRYAYFIKPDEGIDINSGNTGKIQNKSFGITDFNAKDEKGSLYTKYVGHDKWVLKGSQKDSLEHSDQVVNYAYYTDKLTKNVKESGKYFTNRSKFNDPNDARVKDIKENLDKVLKGLQIKDINASDMRYDLNPDNGYTHSPIPQFSEAMGGTNGYDYINKVTNKDQGFDKQFKYFTATRFANIRTIDPIPDGTSDNEHYGFAGSGRSDKINTIGVIGREQFALHGEGSKTGKLYDPTTDDVISFYFHDLVNDRYLPFRSVFKGISESATAEWNDVSYLGRADKLYTYKGFTRSLSFSFTVNISSIKEFAPTWQKINYFMGLVKPANYTAKNETDLLTFSRFIVPPMIKFTIGDLYVDQPGLITSIGFSVPDDAAWETLDETYASKKPWVYLNNVIQWTGSENKYAQLPRTIDFSVSMNLLEKEKPIVGGSQFGSAYHTDPYYKTLSKPQTTFSSNLLVK
jgi:hypothetical protein